MSGVPEYFIDQSAMLCQLWQAFPQPCSLWVVDFTDDLELDEFGLHSPRHLRCLGCMQWLASEGWIRYQDQERELGVNQVVLTQKALLSLLQPVDGLTLMEQIQAQRPLLPNEDAQAKLQQLGMRFLQGAGKD